MKKTKKFAAIILVAAMLTSVLSVLGFADGSEKNILETAAIYRNNQGRYFIKSEYYPGVEYGSEITLYEISESGEKILMKEFSEEEVYYFESTDSVELPDLSEDKKYCFEVLAPYTAEDGTVVYETEYYDFACDDLKAEKPQFICQELEVDENESFDLNDLVLYPIGYDGEVSFKVFSYYEYYDEFSIVVEPEYAEIEGTVLTALNDGEAYIDIYDNNGEYSDLLVLYIEEAGPDSFGEKLFDAYEDFSDMMLGFAGNSLVLGIFGGFWIIVLLMAPFVLLLSMVFGI